MNPIKSSLPNGIDPSLWLRGCLRGRFYGSEKHIPAQFFTLTVFLTKISSLFLPATISESGWDFAGQALDPPKEGYEVTNLDVKARFVILASNTFVVKRQGPTKYFLPLVTEFPGRLIWRSVRRLELSFFK
jgi:hypothetical protein